MSDVPALRSRRCPRHGDAGSRFVRRDPVRSVRRGVWDYRANKKRHGNDPEPILFMEALRARGSVRRRGRSITREVMPPDFGMPLSARVATSVVFPSKCSVEARASAFVTCTVPIRVFRRRIDRVQLSGASPRVPDVVPSRRRERRSPYTPSIFRAGAVDPTSPSPSSLERTGPVAVGLLLDLLAGVGGHQHPAAFACPYRNATKIGVFLGQVLRCRTRNPSWLLLYKKKAKQRPDGEPTLVESRRARRAEERLRRSGREALHHGDVVVENAEDVRGCERGAESVPCRPCP